MTSISSLRPRSTHGLRRQRDLFAVMPWNFPFWQVLRFACAALAVLDHVTPGMAAFREETFGPVAAVVRARDDDHAVALANETEFGLGAAVWGEPGHALAVGRRIPSGALFVNTVVASDRRLPFGGAGRSGYGRELSAEGVREFTNVRTVAVA